MDHTIREKIKKHSSLMGEGQESSTNKNFSFIINRTLRHVDNCFCHNSSTTKLRWLQVIIIIKKLVSNNPNWHAESTKESRIYKFREDCEKTPKQVCMHKQN